jgi:hypothetical protein
LGRKDGLTTRRRTSGLTVRLATVAGTCDFTAFFSEAVAGAVCTAGFAFRTVFFACGFAFAAAFFAAGLVTALRATGLVFFAAPLVFVFDVLEAGLVFAFDFTAIIHILFLQIETPSASILRDNGFNNPGIVHADIVLKT